MPKKQTIGPAPIAAVKAIDFEMLAIDVNNVKISRNRVDPFTDEPYVAIDLAGIRVGWTEPIATITADSITIFGAATTDTEIALTNALLGLYTDRYRVELREPARPRDGKVVLIDATIGRDVRDAWEKHLGTASDPRRYRHPVGSVTVDRERGLASYNDYEPAAIPARNAAAV